MHKQWAPILFGHRVQELGDGVQISCNRLSHECMLGCLQLGETFGIQKNSNIHVDIVVLTLSPYVFSTAVKKSSIYIWSALQDGKHIFRFVYMLQKLYYGAA